MDVQLSRVIEMLDIADIEYWVDSGTLLGLVRDGELLEHDRDIDIGIWQDDATRLIDLVESFRDANYRIRVAFYLGELYEFKLLPHDSMKRKIDIKVYQSACGHAWNPFTVPRGVYGRERVIATLKRQWWAPWRNAHLISNAFLRRLPRLYRLRIDMSRYPWTEVYELWTWWIPTELLKERVYESNLSVWMPARAEEYLEYRYGDWRTPVKEWVYLRDDKGVVRKSPEVLLTVPVVK